jgi:hypothetical protein
MFSTNYPQEDGYTHIDALPIPLHAGVVHCRRSPKFRRAGNI